jgi:hypothetical protein
MQIEYIKNFLCDLCVLCGEKDFDVTKTKEG